MLGHKLWRTARESLDVRATIRTPAALPVGVFAPEQVVAEVRIEDFATVTSAIIAARPDAVVNCIGVVKQSSIAHDAIQTIETNALFPHRLARVCSDHGAKLIHISTDCVFSGRRGNYAETDVPDAEDLYGRSKCLGEPGDGVLTLRTSIIGRELNTSNGLVEWFLSQRGGRVDGYTDAIFSGVTTTTLSELIVSLIQTESDLVGTYHVAGDPISKYELLGLLNSAYGARVTIDAHADVRVNRSLDGTRFREAYGFSAAAWPESVADMAADKAPYEQWRSGRVS